MRFDFRFTSYRIVNQPFSCLKNTLYGVFLACVLLFASCRQAQKESPARVAHADSIIDGANNLLNNGHPDHCLVYLDSAYGAFKEPGTASIWRKYNKKADIYLNYKSDTVKSKLYLDSMTMLLKGKEQLYKYEYAETIYAQGNLFQFQKKYNEAFKYYYDGRVYAQKNLDICSLCEYDGWLGLVRHNQGQYLKAVPYLKLAIKECGYCSTQASFYYTFVFPQSTMNTTALCFEKAGVLDSAVIYYQKALAFVSKSALRFPEKEAYISSARGVIAGNLGGVYAKMNNYTQAEKYLKESISINDRAGYAIEDAQTAKLKLADLYVKSRNFKEAGALLQQLETDIKTGRGKSRDNQIVLMRWHQLAWQYYDKTSAIAQAYMHLKDYYHMRDSVNEISHDLKNADMDAAFKDNEQQYKVALLSKDNKLKSVYLVTIMIFTGMAVCILLVVWQNLKRSRAANRLITEQNSQMQKTLADLEQSQEDNTRMMRIAAHDLRNPVGAVSILASRMMQDPERSTQDREMLETIKRSAKNSLELVSDLLQVRGRAEELKKEPEDLYVMLNYCVNQLRLKAEAKKQQIRLQADHLVVPVNREKLWRVVSNLITNAIKFSPVGSGILVRMEAVAGKVVISVEDHGIGIPEEMKDKIFDMFTEAKRRGTAGEQTFGLGLAISKQIMESHGGRIWFESKPNNGATFFIELPPPFFNGFPVS